PSTIGPAPGCEPPPGWPPPPGLPPPGPRPSVRRTVSCPKLPRNEPQGEAIELTLVFDHSSPGWMSKAFWYTTSACATEAHTTDARHTRRTMAMARSLPL